MAHTHSHPHATLSVKALRYSLAATFAYVLITLFAGIRAHSLALLSESGHNVTDLLALLREVGKRFRAGKAAVLIAVVASLPNPLVGASAPGQAQGAKPRIAVFSLTNATRAYGKRGQYVRGSRVGHHYLLNT